MNNAAIQVENLGKSYRIGGLQARYKRFTEALMEALTLPIRRLTKLGRPVPTDETLWALKDISFEIKQGEVVGIIGRNGAGKSTLLKVISRITEPTEGEARIFGRVGSLLEVGTGFHPELTGRENIYLNGAILGMRKAEIEKKFDEIVDFAEVEKFIDTPVKRYSSGMFVRLAFAVAAHLEPEILLVDEVLAVGDTTFQKKCLGKMSDVSKQGRTVLFVSHNMAAINRLCDKGIWLNDGMVRYIGSAEQAVAAYLSTGLETKGEHRWEDSKKAPGDGRLRLRAVRVLDSANKTSSIIDVKEPFWIEIEYDILVPLLGIQLGFSLCTADGIIAFVAGDNEDSRWLGKIREPGRFKSTCRIPGLLLNSGTYYLSFASDLRNAEILLRVDNALRIQVEQTVLPAHSNARPVGVICPHLEWNVRMIG